jgi:glycerol-3-phosphate dehydrogenase
VHGVTAGSFDRAANLERLASTPFDVLVVGGGITGAGVALDAASRGLRTALIERDDYASGTSSKSSKMVHGGLRYLQQGEIGLVYQALHERQRLRHNAPHLVGILPFLLPTLTKGGPIPRKLAWALGQAMWLYDLTGGLRIGKKHEKLSKAEVLEHMPTLKEGKVAGGYLYYDAKADDARLVLTLVRSAVLDHGAAAANGVRLTGLTTGSDGRIDGAEVAVDDPPEGQDASFRIAASVVVNAAGVWSDDVRELAEGTHPDSIRPAKGVHISVPWDLVQNDIAAVVPVPGDKRSVFVVPWGFSADDPAGGHEQFTHTYIGTTDTDYDGPVDDPQCTPEDVEYLLRAINGAIEGTITEADIVGTWAGLRPLVKDAGSERTADLSRRHKVRQSDDGLVTITGGKLTTYREMSEDTVDEVRSLLPAAALAGTKRSSQTKKLKVHGAAGWEQVVAQASAGPVPDGQLERLVRRYGTDTPDVVALVGQDGTLGEPLVAGQPYLRAEALYAVREEMARSLDDVLSRRTRSRLFARDASADAAEAVATLIGPELGWDDAEQAAQVKAYREAVTAERTAAGLPETTVTQA